MPQTSEEPTGRDDAYARELEHRLDMVLFENEGLRAEPQAAAWLVRAALESSRCERAERIVMRTEEVADRHPQVAALTTAAVHVRALLEGDAAMLSTVAAWLDEPLARGVAFEDAGLILEDSGQQEAALIQFTEAKACYETARADRDTARVRARLRGLGVRTRHWTSRPRPTFGWESLTDTELRVVDLVAEGLTNREVAARMFLSRHTIDFHLRQVFRKLDICSRVQLTRLAVERNSTAAS